MNNNKPTMASHPSSDDSVPLVFVSFSPYDDDPQDGGQETYDFQYFLKWAYSMCRGISATDAEDIAQEAWISFSLKFMDGDIINAKAYSVKVICNKFFDYLRKQQKRSLLPTISLSAYTEHTHIEFMKLCSEKMSNSAYEPGKRIEEMDSLHELAIALRELPCRQRRAMACTVLDKMGDSLPLRQVFMYHHIAESEMCWPTCKEEKRVLQASLPAARRKLANLIHIDLGQYRQKKRSPQPVLP